MYDSIKVYQNTRECSISYNTAGDVTTFRIYNHAVFYQTGNTYEQFTIISNIPISFMITFKY